MKSSLLKWTFLILVSLIISAFIFPVNASTTGSVIEDIEENWSYTAEYKNGHINIIRLNTYIGQSPNVVIRNAYRIKGELCTNVVLEYGVIDRPHSSGYSPFMHNKSIKTISFEDGFKAPEDMSYMFAGTSAQYIDLSGLDTSRTTNMKGLFQESEIINVNLGSINTSKVKDMSYMFFDAYKLISVNLSGLNTSNVKDMSNMFGGCRNIISINMRGLDTSKVSNMSRMFYFCPGLISIAGLDNFNIPNVQNTSEMFSKTFFPNNLNLYDWITLDMFEPGISYDSEMCKTMPLPANLYISPDDLMNDCKISYSTGGSQTSNNIPAPVQESKSNLTTKNKTTAINPFTDNGTLKSIILKEVDI